MVGYKKIILLFVSIITCTCLSAQNIDNEEDIISFDRNYDNLLQSYYMKTNEKILNERFPSTSSMPISSSAKSVSDETYRQRLNSIPSAVKLVYNNTVRSHIIYYLDKRSHSVSVMLGVSQYYFPIFENILDSYGVPSELKYLVMIESAFNPKAVSRAGATGLWQFMYATGRTYDLRVNSVVDDRRDPIKSTIAAAKFLRDLYHIYNDWSLVLAAYNCGPGNVNKAIKRSGKNDFWELYNYLPKETRNYVPAYIAATYVMNFYQEHGIKPMSLTQPLDLITDTVMVNKDIYFGQIEDVLKVSTDEIKGLNPQYKMDYIPGTQDKYALRLPLTYINDFIEMEDSISNCNIEKYRPELAKKETIEDSNTIYVNKTIYHKVKRNETWSSIARRYDVSVSELRGWNKKIKKNKLQKGALLAINTKVAVNKTTVIDKDEDEKSSAFSQDEMVEANSSNSQEEVTTNTKKVDKINTSTSNKKVEFAKQESKKQNEEIKKDNGRNAKQNAEKKKSNKTHTVQSGETIAAIAKKHGMSEKELLKLNGLNEKSARKIRPGQKLKLK